MIEQLIKRYDFSRVQWQTTDDPSILDPVFAVSFKAVPARLDGPVFSSPALKLFAWNKSESDPVDYQFNKQQQNYFSAKSADGSCRVLEAFLFMECDLCAWRIGFPLALLEDQEKEYEITLLFDGVYFQILCDGKVMDREAPEGVVKHDHENKGGKFSVFADVKEFRFTNDLSRVERKEEHVFRDIPIAYYTPYGFNTWIGDVVTFAHEGLFHIFYLHDRRHHQSRRRKGAHEFWHMTSSDLKNWVDHGPVLELNEQWQSMGTGNAFVFDGKLHLSFGWHTERAKPWEQRTNRLFYENVEKLGHTGEFSYDEIGSLTPGGASYAYSEDGIHFTPSNKLMHYLENPSIFVQEDGTLNLYQEGTWKSDHPGAWRLVDPDFPPCYAKSFARNCLDCPTFFSLDGWDYFAVGFSGFFGKPSGSDKWIDFVEKGWDPYDGCSVPMAAGFNGRMIEGSWPAGNSWGSCLLLRELIPLGGGRLGKRWIPETLPEFSEAQSVGCEVELPKTVYTLFEVEIDPAGGVFTALFTGKPGEMPVEFSFDPAIGRAQWNSVPGRKLKTYREKVLEHPEYDHHLLFADTHHKARDYARENLIVPEKPFLLKIIVCCDPKFDATLLDVEIGGLHTMLTLRNDLRADKAVFSGGRIILKK